MVILHARIILDNNNYCCQIKYKGQYGYAAWTHYTNSYTTKQKHVSIFIQQSVGREEWDIIIITQLQV